LEQIAVSTRLEALLQSKLAAMEVKKYKHKTKDNRNGNPPFNLNILILSIVIWKTKVKE